MAQQHVPHPVHQRNGHATIGGSDRHEHSAADRDENQPKGHPTSDRYHAETAHVAETDDHTDHLEADHAKTGHVGVGKPPRDR
jgi:hypothetical protein